MTQQNHAVGRPRMSEHERRCKQMKIRLTIAEQNHLREQARLAGLTVAEYGRRRALSLPVQPRSSISDAKLLHELNAIGNNLNQIARNLNAGRKGSGTSDLAHLQSRLQRILTKVGAAL